MFVKVLLSYGMVFFFASNKRLWSVSRGLRDILKVRRYDSGLPPRFHYDGSCYLSELKSYLDDVGIGVSDFVKVTPTNDALSIYEDVFGTWEGG
jgi:hypothetical protein